ncbi:MAG: ABC transporter permease subunit [Candidatus Sericytochromatia bacterium]|nr:ABC transporter permease subunit [Candidatus Sericytochromatia bacterium]
MSKIFAIAGREMRSYFGSPLAFVVAAMFILVVGYLFSLILFHTKQANFQPLFSNMSVMLLLVIPALTMRLIADERKTGTIELLMTSPIHDRDLVIGKYLAALIYLGFLVALTMAFPLLVALSSKLEWWVILSGYLGVYLLGASFMAIGVLASSLTANMIIAAMITFALSLVIWLLPSAGQIFGGAAADVMTYLSVINHQENMGRGVLDSSDLVFYLSFITACLFMAVRSVETYHWR